MDQNCLSTVTYRVYPIFHIRCSVSVAHPKQLQTGCHKSLPRELQGWAAVLQGDPVKCEHTIPNCICARKLLEKSNTIHTLAKMVLKFQAKLGKITNSSKNTGLCKIKAQYFYEFKDSYEALNGQKYQVLYYKVLTNLTGTAVCPKMSLKLCQSIKQSKTQWLTNLIL